MLCVLLLVEELIPALDEFSAGHMLGIAFEVLVSYVIRVCADSPSAICRGEQRFDTAEGP